MHKQIALATLLLSANCLAQPPKDWPKTAAEVLEATTQSDWRRPDPAHTLYIDLAQGRVVVELTAQFAPEHVHNILQLVRQGYFNALPIVRSQDNYVVQWGDPDGKRDLGKAAPKLAGEYSRPFNGLNGYKKLPDGDVYAPEVGFISGLPVAVDRNTDRAWLAHCYGMLGAGRGDAADSGNGAELYVVIGHAPRHLDRNVTLVGRVLEGMEFLSTLPRGHQALGFYDDASERRPLLQVQVAADLPDDQREQIELLRTDGEAFSALMAARRTRTESWFLEPTGKVELCNVPLPVRRVAAGEGAF